MRFIQRNLVGVLILTSVACRSTAGTLTLGIEGPDGPVEAESAVIKVVLTNNSPNNYWLNGRLLPGPKNAPAADRERSEERRVGKEGRCGCTTGEPRA